MPYSVDFSARARRDVRRLTAFLAERDAGAARKALAAIQDTIATLENYPFRGRIGPTEDTRVRELVIAFGNAGYLALYGVEGSTVTILAIRHQLEDDYL